MVGLLQAIHVRGRLAGTLVKLDAEPCPSSRWRCWGSSSEVKAAAEDLRPILLAGAEGPVRGAGRSPQGRWRRIRRSASSVGVPRAPPTWTRPIVLVYAIEGETRRARQDEQVLRLASRKSVPALVIVIGRGAEEVRRPPVRARHGRDPRPAQGSLCPLEEIIERIADAGRRQELCPRRAAARGSVKPSVTRSSSTSRCRTAILGSRDLHPRRGSARADAEPDAHGASASPAAYGADVDRERAVEILLVVLAPAWASERWRARSWESCQASAGRSRAAIAYAGTRALGEAAIALLRCRWHRCDCGVRPVPVLAFRDMTHATRTRRTKCLRSRKRMPGSSTSRRPVARSFETGATTRSSPGRGHASTSGSAGRATADPPTPGGRVGTLRKARRSEHSSSGRQSLLTVPLLPCRDCAGRTEFQ